MESLTPKNHAEAVAVFRHGIIGSVTQAEMDRGQLAAALEALSKQRFLPPKAKSTTTFSRATLERWYYAFKKRGLDGLKPRRRKDKGRAKQLQPEQRQLLVDIRREPPHASAPVILRTLVAAGRLETDAIYAIT